MSNRAHACHCMGKRNGEPFCPCEMRAKGIVKRDGKWVQPEVVIGDVIEPSTGILDYYSN